MEAGLKKYASDARPAFFKSVIFRSVKKIRIEIPTSAIFAGSLKRILSGNRGKAECI